MVYLLREMCLLFAFVIFTIMWRWCVMFTVHIVNHHLEVAVDFLTDVVFEQILEDLLDFLFSV